ncbi:MAG: AAA family ATPase [Anaerolineales bacterium]
MIISHLALKNWRNFRAVNEPLRERMFVVGPNASGKSNLLDAFRFLRDIAKSEGGGLQKAVKDRGGVSKLRCLAARSDPEISIDVQISEDVGGPILWRYVLGIKQEIRGFRQPYVSFERVWRDGERIINRPDKEDNSDEERLKQTYLEQVNTNKDFRDVARFLSSITYLHIVPQLLRFPEFFQAAPIENDPFGQGFLERVATARPSTQQSRLRIIEGALKFAVPQLQQLRFERDGETGRPHLAALYSHWRPNAGWQREDQFSDGTLRLIGLLWALLDGDSLLLLEEPELSLNSGITRHLAALIHRMQRRRRRQVIVTTHSETLLNDPGISGDEILVLFPDAEGTTARIANSIKEVKDLLVQGMPPGDIVLAKTRSQNAMQLSFFDE